MVQPVNKPTLYDVILIVTITVISTILIILPITLNTNNAQGIEITVDGKIHSTYQFDELKNGQIIEINTEYGYNKFIYENRSIKCIDTNCKDKIEIHSGTISKTNQVLVCLPHKLTVQIIGKKKLDGISY